MAELRLITARLVVLSVVAVAACRSSEAGPGSGLTPPAGWQTLPQLATAARDAAKESRLTVDGVEAWGDTSRGCYAAWFALRGGGGAPDVMADQLVKSLSVEPALLGILVHDVVKPAPASASGVLSLSFVRGAYRGKLRATLAKDGKLAALTCFWSHREPLACEQGCNALVGSMR